jgi:hypothetical protein
VRSVDHQVAIPRGVTGKAAPRVKVAKTVILRELAQERR